MLIQRRSYSNVLSVKILSLKLNSTTGLVVLLRRFSHRGCCGCPTVECETEFSVNPPFLWTPAARSDGGLRSSSTRAAQEEVTTETRGNLQRIAERSGSEVCVCVCVCVSMWLSFCLLITNPVRSGCADMIFMQCTWVCRTLWCLCKCLYCLFSPELCREPISTESHFPLSSLVPLLLSLLSSARPWGRWKMFMRKILKWETLLVWHPKSARQPRI